MRKCDFMRKRIIVLFVLLSVFFMPIKANALEINFNNSFVQIGEKNTSNTNNSDPSTWDDAFNQDQNCNGDDSILGNKNKENSSPENEALAVEEKAENAEAAERMPRADIVSEKDVSLVKK